MRFKDFINTIKENRYEYNEIDLDRAYELFRNEYIKATGKSWSKSKFLDKARKWTFFGDEDGFVAVRFQTSGYVKLVGMAGSRKSKLLGFRELMSKGYPIWAGGDAKLTNILVSQGFIRVPYILLKLFEKVIEYQMGSIPITVNKDGSITIDYYDVGPATKYIVATKEYFEKVLDDYDVPTIAKTLIKKLLNK